MRGILLRIRERLHETKKVERFWCYSVLVLVVIGMTIPLGAAHAAWGGTDFLNLLLTGVAYLLQWVIIALGKLVLFLVDIIIRVAQYNTFVHAGPVQTGWPIIRDVINMFFIVVLLISAFSTIIGYGKYHYSELLKSKFFLMAVLVNFSLPLFGLAIDVSQVLMLTFVNGFRAAAAGNFVTILKLDQVMKIDKVDLSPDNGSNAVENPMVLKVTAMMFGIFILGISATILAIMVVYLVGRIVGLWILLITSPGAMLVTGLPSALKGHMKGLGQAWWDRLWGLLVGGPMMAFFLWLTLATAANIGPTFTDKSTSVYAGEAEADSAENYFETAIGSVENFGTYIVAIVMLFEGLSTAMKSATDIAPIAGRAASKIKEYGVGTTKMLAYGGIAAGGAWAGRQVGGAVGEAGGAVGGFFDRRYGITKGVGSTIQTIGMKTGWVGAAKAGATIAGTRGRAVKKQQEKFEELTKGLSTGKRMDFAKERINSILSNADEKKALTEMHTKDAFSGPGQKHLLSQYDAAAKEKFGEVKSDKDLANASDEVKSLNTEKKLKVEAYKKSRLLEDRKKMLSDFEKTVGENETNKKWIGEKMEAMPSHAEDVMAYVSDKISTDPSYPSKAKTEEFENVSLDIATLKAAGFKGNEMADQGGVVAGIMKRGDRKAKMLRTTHQALQDLADKKQMTIEQVLNDNALLKSSGLMTAMLLKDDKEPEGHRMVMIDSASGTSKPESIAAPQVQRNDAAIEVHRAAMEQAREQVAKLESEPAGAERDASLAQAIAEIQRTQREMLNAGEASEKVFRMSSDGRINDARDLESFASSMQNVFQEGKKDYKTYAKVNLSVIHQNPKGQNDARTAVVQHANVGDLSLAFMAASAMKDKAATTNIADIIHAIEGEGSRSQAPIDYYNKNASAKGQDIIDVHEVAKAGQMYAQSQSDLGKKKATEMIQKAIKNSGLIITADDAVAIAKRQEVLADPALQHSANLMSKRAKEARKRGQKNA